MELTWASRVTFLTILLVQCRSHSLIRNATDARLPPPSDEQIAILRQAMYRYHNIVPAASDVMVSSSSSSSSARHPASFSNQTKHHHERVSLLRSAKKSSKSRRVVETQDERTTTRRELSSLPGKKGAAFLLRPSGQPGSWETNLPKVIALQPYWNYAWSANRIDQQPDYIEWVPMIWGAWGMQGLQTTMDTVIKPAFYAGQAKRLLGFNEPDGADQANMPVSSAVQCWPLLEIPGMPLASPAVATLGGPWLGEFVDQIESQNLYMDYIAVHWYGSADISSFQSEMWSIYQTYGAKWPLLITEFAPADWSAQTVAENSFSNADVLSFMKSALPWIESQNWISGYAWFSFDPTYPQGTSSALYDSNDNLTPLGQFYASVRTDNPTGDQSITC